MLPLKTLNQVAQYSLLDWARPWTRQSNRERRRRGKTRGEIKANGQRFLLSRAQTPQKTQHIKVPASRVPELRHRTFNKPSLSHLSSTHLFLRCIQAAASRGGVQRPNPANRLLSLLLRPRTMRQSTMIIFPLLVLLAWGNMIISLVTPTWTFRSERTKEGWTVSLPERLL